MDWSGNVHSTTNGGSTWSSHSTSTTNVLYGISCASTSSCRAVGDSGTIVATTNGGTSWSSQPSGTTNTLYGISCTSTSSCGSNGGAGTIDGLAGSVPVPIAGNGIVREVVLGVLAVSGAGLIYWLMRRRVTRPSA